jgi:hypothetical protein
MPQVHALGPANPITHYRATCSSETSDEINIAGTSPAGAPSEQTCLPEAEPPPNAIESDRLGTFMGRTLGA